MLSKEAAGKFAELTASTPSIKGSTDKVTKATPALASVSEKLAAAGDSVFTWHFRDWYAAFTPTPVVTEMTNLLTGRYTADQFLDKMQSIADGVAKDSSIPKYKVN
jgi:N-acetylglucosamine transport system substrate-binding protein